MVFWPELAGAIRPCPWFGPSGCLDMTRSLIEPVEVQLLLLDRPSGLHFSYIELVEIKLPALMSTYDPLRGAVVGGDLRGYFSEN
ncbi:hypothetical protein C3B61_07395 [Cryobacterium zongtaii]|uniref:Uncharacterized protein n=1 Tax=Cryobacterium zongtaii TaxID=1259217 RepID=A0A2S3ZHG9_9MICO|nr:hypothetical protein C3B61_07395 [Cryobacterium zongtaii]